MRMKRGLLGREIRSAHLPCLITINLPRCCSRNGWRFKWRGRAAPLTRYLRRASCACRGARINTVTRKVARFFLAASAVTSQVNRFRLSALSTARRGAYLWRSTWKCIPAFPKPKRARIQSYEMQCVSSPHLTANARRERSTNRKQYASLRRLTYSTLKNGRLIMRRTCALEIRPR